MSNPASKTTKFTRPNGRPSWRKEWDERRCNWSYRGVLVDNGVVTWRCADAATRPRYALKDARDGGCWRSYDGQKNGWTADMAWMPEDLVRVRQRVFFEEWGKSLDRTLLEMRKGQTGATPCQDGDLPF
jgi:hypothetical protein